MKKLITLFLLTLMLFSASAYARGGFSSGGGRSSGFSSSRSYGGGSSRSYSSPQRSSRIYGNRSYGTTTHVYHYGGGYVHPYGMYGGFGMGYGYNNGLITGMIIGNMMHPQGTVIYNGGGYGGQALLYPNGAVVDNTGHQIGTYVNGQFSPVQNGVMMAQMVPEDAQQQVTVADNSETSFLESLATAVVFVVSIFLFIILFFFCVG